MNRLKTKVIPPPPESIQKSSETVVYLGMFYPIWGHIITDDIRRLWFLKSEYFNQFKDCPLVYTDIWTPLKKQINFCRLLEILEIDVGRLKLIEQPTQFEKIIIPDGSFSSAKGFTNEYRETIDRIRNFAIKNQTPTSCKKIYYFHGRRQFGEERLAEYFKSKGYEIIQPEKLTLDEQLNLLINCESFASNVGSISHNSIFLRDAIETILIPRYNNAFMSHQLVSHQIREQNVTYIDSSFSIFYTRNGPFCYIISEQLKRFFGDKFDGYEEEDFKIFLQYVKNSIGKGLLVNHQQIKGYGSVFTDFMEQLKQHEDLIASFNMPVHWEQFRQPLTYQTHIHIKGWVAWQNEEQLSGFTEDKLDIQAVKIDFPNHKVYYSVYYNDKEGWSEEVSNGEQAGTTGKTKAIYGIKIRLDEAGQQEFDILYRVHKFGGEWTDWAKNGETLYSYGVKLNALQIKLETKK